MNTICKNLYTALENSQTHAATSCHSSLKVCLNKFQYWKLSFTLLGEKEEEASFLEKKII